MDFGEIIIHTKMSFLGGKNIVILIDISLPGTVYLEDVLLLVESTEIEKSIFKCKIRFETCWLALNSSFLSIILFV